VLFKGESIYIAGGEYPVAPVKSKYLMIRVKENHFHPFLFGPIQFLSRSSKIERHGYKYVSC
jgi:hypothetical protein